MINYLDVTSKRLEELSKVKFFDEKNESLKSTIVSLLSEIDDQEKINEKIRIDHFDLIKEISDNSNIQIILKNKRNSDIEDILNELIEDHSEQGNLKKIESLEKKLIKSLDEGSYSELIKLKSQLNRE